MQWERKFIQLELPLTYGGKMGYLKTMGGGAEESIAEYKTESSVEEESLIKNK